MTETVELSFPMSRSCPLSPPPDYERLRQEQPVARVRTPGGWAWLVTRHADVRAVLTDPRFSSDRRHPGFPAQPADRQRRHPGRPHAAGPEQDVHPPGVPAPRRHGRRARPRGIGRSRTGSAGPGG